MFFMGKTDILLMVGSDDPLYNLRQVEQLLANHFTYAWFDPMTQYPVGSTIYWGPLFPTIIAICLPDHRCVTRPEIIGIWLLIPPMMAAITVVPIMYYVGKSLRGLENRDSGIRFYRDCIWTVFLPVALRVYGSPYRRSALLHALLPALYVYPAIQKKRQKLT